MGCVEAPDPARRPASGQAARLSEREPGRRRSGRRTRSARMPDRRTIHTTPTPRSFSQNLFNPSPSPCMRRSAAWTITTATSIWPAGTSAPRRTPPHRTTPSPGSSTIPSFLSEVVRFDLPRLGDIAGSRRRARAVPHRHRHRVARTPRRHDRNGLRLLAVGTCHRARQLAHDAARRRRVRRRRALRRTGAARHRAVRSRLHRRRHAQLVARHSWLGSGGDRVVYVLVDGSSSATATR